MFVFFAIVLLLKINVVVSFTIKSNFNSNRLYRFTLLRAQSDIKFTSVKILENKDEAIDLKSISIEVTDEIQEAYSTPGQYVQMKVGDGKPGFYAIASPPSSESSSASNKLSFLIKETENNHWLTRADIGSSVDMSIALGKGFKIEENFDEYKFDFPTMRVVMMACGSGIAPIVAAIESDSLKLKESGYNSLFPRQGVLYLGARTSKHIPFQSRFKSWEDRGVQVIPVLSQPEDDWTGRKGYIQDALKEDGVEVPRNSGVLLCGQRGMVDDAKELLLSEGVFEGRILLNF